MADNIEVEPIDDTVIEVDLGDGGQVDPPETPQEVVPPPEPRRQRSREAADAAVEAAAALTKAQETLEAERRARVAAEQTAVSERAARQTAEQEAQRRAEEARGYRSQAETTELNRITGSIEATTRDISAAKAAFKTAFEAGDADAQANAQEQLGKATARLVQLEANKETQEARLAAAPTEAAPAQSGAPSTFEAYVSKFSPRAQAWLRQNPDCIPASVGGSDQKNSLMMAGHYEAISKGYRTDSDEYFRTIDEKVKGPVSSAAAVVPAAAVTTPAAAPAAPARRPQPSAPVSREAPGAVPGMTNNGKLSLTRDMQEIALISYPKEKDESVDAWRKRAFGTYANEYVGAYREGKIGRRLDGM